MTGLAIAFGTALCDGLGLVGATTQRCHNPTDLAAVGSTVLVFAGVLTLGWQVARRRA